MSFYNTLKSTLFTGPISVTDSTVGANDGSASIQRSLNVSENVYVDGEAAFGAISPLTSVTVNNTTTLPSTISTLATIILQTAVSPYTVTLPAPDSGYVLYFLNRNNSSTVTLTSPTTLYYENPIGTFNTGTSLALVDNAYLELYSDGTAWYVVYNSAIYSAFGGGSQALLHLEYDALTNTITATSNFTVELDLKVEGNTELQQTTLDGNLIVASTTISPTEISYLDGTSSNIQTQLNALRPTVVLYTTATTISPSSFSNGTLILLAAATPQTLTLNAPSASVRSYLVLNNQGAATWTLSSASIFYYVNSAGAQATTTALSVPAGSYVVLYCDLSQFQVSINSTLQYPLLGGNNVFTGNNTLNGTTTLNNDLIAASLNISPTEVSYLENAASNIQAQLNGKGTLAGNNTWTGTNDFTNTTTFTGNISANAATITPTVLSYISTLASNAQTQINKITPSYVVYVASGSFDPSSYGSGTVIRFQTGTPGQTLTLNGSPPGDVRAYMLVNSGVQPFTISTTATLFYINSTGGLVTGSSFSFPIGSAGILYTISSSEYFMTFDSGSQYAWLGKDNTFSGTTTFTGNISANAATITPTVLSYISTLASNAQNQLDALRPTVTTYTTSTTISPSSFSNGTMIQLQGATPQTLTLSAPSATTRSFLVFNNQGATTWTLASATPIYYITNAGAQGTTTSLSIPPGSYTLLYCNLTQFVIPINSTFQHPLLGGGNTFTGANAFENITYFLDDLVPNTTGGPVAVTPDALSYVANLTSDAQTQLTKITPTLVNISTSVSLPNTTPSGSLVFLSSASTQTLTLPAPIGDTRMYVVYNTGNGTFTITPAGGVTLNVSNTAGGYTSVASISFVSGSFGVLYTTSATSYLMTVDSGSQFAWLGKANTFSGNNIFNGTSTFNGSVAFNGSITTPISGPEYGCSVTQSTGQSIPNNTTTRMTFNTVNYNYNTGGTGTGWVAANNEYQVPVSGKYLVVCTANFAAGAWNANADFTIQLAGVSPPYNTRTYVPVAAASTRMGNSFSVVVNATALDILYIVLFQLSGASQTLISSPSVNYLQIQRLSS